MRTLLAVCFAAFLAGCGAPPAEPALEPAPADISHVVRWTLPVRGANELNFDLEEGSSVSFRLNASAPILWDLHSHSDAGVVTNHREGEGRVGEGNFTAPAADTYSVFARSTGSTTIVELRLTGQFTLLE